MNAIGYITTMLFVLIFFTLYKSNHEDKSPDIEDAGVETNDSAPTYTETDTCLGCMSLDEGDVDKLPQRNDCHSCQGGCNAFYFGVSHVRRNRQQGMCSNVGIAKGMTES